MATDATLQIETMPGSKEMPASLLYDMSMFIGIIILVVIWIVVRGRHPPDPNDRDQPIGDTSTD